VTRVWTAVALVLLLVVAVIATTLIALQPTGEEATAPRTRDSIDRDGPTPSRVDASMPATDPALADFYEQDVDWVECSTSADHRCARIEVPLDYTDPAGERIELSLLKVPAARPDDRVGSLVVNPGGPGAPGTSYAAQAGALFGQPLLDHFDIVGFDPRGTGDSTTVDCVSDAELDAWLAGDPAPDTPAEEAGYVDRVDSFGAGCSADAPLSAHVSTAEAARDMDVIRAVLGEPRLDYLGASYGTKLGATYAELFPTHAGRMVLDGAVSLSATPKQLGLDQARGFETALRAYVADCVAGGGCFLGDSVDEALQTITDLLDDLDASPMPAGERELTEGLAFYGIITPLYNRDYWILLSSALRSAIEDDDGTALLTLADAYSRRSPTGGYFDNSIEANFVINCLDDPTAVPLDRVDALVPDFERASPTFGRVFAEGSISCRAFTPRSDQPAPEVDARGAAPILVIGTTRDPATPLKWAEQLAEQLDSGVLLRRDGDGHTGYRTGNQCVDAVVEDFLVAGVAPRSAVNC
jgi:pimeloyl-ACP methyl ester carboxylesterase